MPALNQDHSDPYQRRYHWPKWNRTVTVCDVPALFRRLPEFQDWTRANHEDQACALLTAAHGLRAKWNRLVARGIARYGDHGALICAVYREHWPEAYKARLRSAAYGATRIEDQARAHWLAAGRRLSTFRRRLQDG